MRNLEEASGVLRAIASVRAMGVRLPLPLLKRAAELIERGVEPEIAIELECAVVGSAPVAGPSQLLTARQLAEAADVPRSFVDRMIEAGLLVPIPGAAPAFDATDVQMVRTLRPLAEATDLDVRVATPISDGIRDLSRYEMVLRNRAVAGRDEAESAELSLRIQQAVHLIHGYLFYRWRLHDIAELLHQEELAGKGKAN